MCKRFKMNTEGKGRNILAPSVNTIEWISCRFLIDFFFILYPTQYIYLLTPNRFNEMKIYNFIILNNLLITFQTSIN